MLQCLNKTWDLVAIYFQTQPPIKGLDIDEFFGRLSAFSRAQKRRKHADLLHTQKERTLALQVEKRTKKVRVPTEDSNEEDVDDKDLAMIIKSMKKF